MKNAAQNKPAHVTKGNIFLDLGFSASEASVIKIKSKIFSAVLERVRTEGYTQAQLVDILDDNKPSVSNLLNGRISQLSIDKLLEYAYRLHFRTSISLSPMKEKQRDVKSPARVNSRRVAQKRK